VGYKGVQIVGQSDADLSEISWGRQCQNTVNIKHWPANDNGCMCRSTSDNWL